VTETRKNKSGDVEWPPGTMEARMSSDRVGWSAAAAIGLVAIFVIALVVFGLNTRWAQLGAPAQVTEQGGPQSTRQPAATNGQANPVGGQPRQGLMQPATPSQNAVAPVDTGNPAATTGQGHIDHSVSR